VRHAPRAIEPGQDFRAGRWWWEETGAKECGLHVGPQKRRCRALTETWTHLEALEAESIYIIREVVAQFRNPVLLYSIGKDSSVLVHLARKAFLSWPDSISSSSRRYRIQVQGDAHLPR